MKVVPQSIFIIICTLLKISVPFLIRSNFYSKWLLGSWILRNYSNLAKHSCKSFSRYTLPAFYFLYILYAHIYIKTLIHDSMGRREISRFLGQWDSRACVSTSETSSRIFFTSHARSILSIFVRQKLRELREREREREGGRNRERERDTYIRLGVSHPTSASLWTSGARSSNVLRVRTYVIHR